MNFSFYKLYSFLSWSFRKLIFFSGNCWERPESGMIFFFLVPLVLVAIALMLRLVFCLASLGAGL